MAERGGPMVLTKLLDDPSFYKEIERPGLTVVDVYTKWAGPCDSMQAIFKKLLNENAQSDEIASLRKFRNKSQPAFLFFSNGNLVNVVHGANAPVIEKYVKEQSESLKNGGTVANVIGEGSDLVPLKPPTEDVVNTVAASTPTLKYDDYTLALIKPDAVQHYEAIRDAIVKNGMTIVKEKQLMFTKENAQLFYQEHASKPFFPNLVQYMSSGPIIAFQLAKENAFKSWRDMIGPANARRAKEEFPKTIRALYGIDGQRNAVHGSDSLASAIREVSIVFSDACTAVSAPRSERLSLSRQPQQTLAILLPEVVGDYVLQPPLGAEPAADAPKPSLEMHAVEKILYAVYARGLKVAKCSQSVISAEKAAILLGEGDAATNMARASSIALVLEGDYAIEEWLELAGSGPVAEAKESAPTTFRAIYGESDAKPGVLASANLDIATRDLSVIFPARHGTAARGTPPVNRLEKTVAMIKPDAVADENVDAIIKRIQDSGFTVLRRQDGMLTEAKVRQFYRNIVDKPFFKDLLAFMLSGPVVIMELQRDNAMLAWRELIGPADSERAREVAPNSIRAIFGKDNKQNAVYGSDSSISVMQDIAALFDAEVKAPVNATASTNAIPTIQEDKESEPVVTPAAAPSDVVAEPVPIKKSGPSAEKLKESVKNLASNIKSSMQSLTKAGKSSENVVKQEEAAVPADAPVPAVERPSSKGASKPASRVPSAGAKSKSGSKSNMLGSKPALNKSKPALS